MELPDSIRQQLAAEIERERRACGCKSGAAFAIGGFILGVVWWTTFSPHVTVAGVLAGACEIFALVIASAVVGKLAGLGLARVRLRWATARLLARARAARWQPS